VVEGSASYRSKIWPHLQVHVSSSQSYIEWFVVSVDILGGEVRLQFGADVGRERCILDKTQEVAAVRKGRMESKCERQM
jgi:hypothetical protein